MSAPVNLPTQAEVEETVRITLESLGVHEDDLDEALRLFHAGEGSPTARVMAAAREVLERRAATRH